MKDKETRKIQKSETPNGLVGFFDLLLKIDKRVNPHNYENYRSIDSTHQS